MAILDTLTQASPVITGIFILLILTSVVVWVVIIERSLILSGLQAQVADFENRFWSGEDWGELERDLDESGADLIGSPRIFWVGIRLLAEGDIPSARLQRALAVQIDRFETGLQKSVPFLALVAATAPYVGLLGTVWGIIDAFEGIAAAQQATLSSIAPGVSEALVATALGLFAAIPAAVAHNRILVKIDALIGAAESLAEQMVYVAASRDN